MYFPFLRGKLNELAALKDLCETKRISNLVIPIIEPVKLSLSLISTLTVYIKAKKKIALITNPTVGSFLEEMLDAKKNTRLSGFKNDLLELIKNDNIILSFIMDDKNIEDIFKQFPSVNKSQTLAVVQNKKGLENYTKIYKDQDALFTLIPSERHYHRVIHGAKILWDDKFVKRNNKDYTKVELFSEDQLFYKEEKFIGISDYSIVGKAFSDKGFPPFAVAIHIVYFDKNNILNIRHFVSDSNNERSNPAKKFYEAVTKLNNWYSQQSSEELDTLGLTTLLGYYKDRSYHGLGIVKKLSLMHHLELMSQYLDKYEN